LFDGALNVRNKVVFDYVDPGKRYRAVLEAVAQARGWDVAVPWSALPEVAKTALLHGTGDEEFEAVWQHEGAEGGEPHRWRTKWLGIAGDIDREYARRQQSGAVTRGKDFVALLMAQPCAECDGDRLAEPMRSVCIAGHTLPELCRMPVDELLACIRAGMNLPDREQAVASDTTAELQRRLERLVDLGLGHLQLDRVTSTYSCRRFAVLWTRGMRWWPSNMICASLLPRITCSKSALELGSTVVCWWRLVRRMPCRKIRARVAVCCSRRSLCELRRARRQKQS
jgi:excinuclease ABC subunit A